MQDCADWYNDITGSSINATAFQDAYNLLLSDPGYGIKYGLGFINTGMVIAQLQEEFPDASDLEIHTAYLNSLSGTFEQILENARYFLENDELTTPVDEWGDEYEGVTVVTGGNSGDAGDDDDSGSGSGGGGLIGH